MNRKFILFSVLLIANEIAAQFTPGNLVVYRIGDGAAALSATATPAFLDEYTTTGVLIQSIPVPTVTVGANKRLTNSGTATTEGFMTRSTDRRYLVVTGYDAAPGTANVTVSTSAAINRVVARVAFDETINTSTSLTDAISGGNTRGAASTNGTDIWLSGTSSGGGIRYATFGATTSTSLSAAPTNIRLINLFGGQLYATTQSGAFRLFTIGTGIPTTSGQTCTNLPGFPTATGSPYSFFFADLNPGVAGVDVVYVADDGGTLQKYSLVAGNWTANGTFAAATLRGLVGSVSGTTATLYGTRRTILSTFTDATGYNATITGTLTTLATAAVNTAMQGVAFAPEQFALPLNWLSVSGKLSITNQVVITWRVEEQNVTGYQAEKSSDAINFTVIGTIAGKGDGENTYTFTDMKTLTGTAYYRIKQSDADGRFSYSSIIPLRDNKQHMVNIYPNPAKEVATVTVDNSLLNKNVVLSDMYGKVLQTLRISAPSFTINLGSYSDGIYLIKIDKVKPIKLVKE